MVYPSGEEWSLFPFMLCSPLRWDAFSAIPLRMLSLLMWFSVSCYNSLQTWLIHQFIKSFCVKQKSRRTSVKGNIWSKGLSLGKKCHIVHSCPVVWNFLLTSFDISNLKWSKSWSINKAKTSCCQPWDLVNVNERQTDASRLLMLGSGSKVCNRNADCKWEAMEEGRLAKLHHGKSWDA